MHAPRHSTLNTLILSFCIVCSAFIPARAAEKEIPPKIRGGESIKKPSPSDQSEKSDSSDKKTAMRDGEEGARKPGAGDGEGIRKPGMRDGDKPRTGERDGEKPRAGERDGDKPRTGERDGEKPRAGERDGDKPRTGERDGGKPRAGARDGEGSGKPRDGANSLDSRETITLRVSKDGETVLVSDKEVAMSGLRGHLSNFLPEHPGATVIVTGDPDTPLKALHNTVDAVRDNGNKNVRIADQ